MTETGRERLDEPGLALLADLLRTAERHRDDKNCTRRSLIEEILELGWLELIVAVLWMQHRAAAL